MTSEDVWSTIMMFAVNLDLYGACAFQAVLVDLCVYIYVSEEIY